MAADSTVPTGGAASAIPTMAAPPQAVLLDFFFPGFSMFSNAVQKYLHIDLNLYIPLVLLCGAFTFIWRYFSEYFWGLAESHLMSVVDIRTDDEIYNMLMAWVASQRFAQGARRFVVNTNLNSRSWFLWRYDDDDGDDFGSDDDPTATTDSKKKKALAYTPTFGSHWFWYKNRLLIFRRIQNQQQASFLVASEREEISISCFGRNPWVLKELLHEARLAYLKRDEAKTLIYRGTTKSGSTDATWQRCMARTSRPFSTVILNDKVKTDLIDDVTDYLNPATRRWYSNRGIPYRRGYLLYGPPGTGKSSLSLALAGFFKMRIYIVSLSSVSASEENLASLFAELPRRCVVLLEDIDTAGLTHTREDAKNDTPSEDGADADEPPKRKVNKNGTPAAPVQTPPIGRLSLSGLLNILDGVASQEGRVLIMTTNHLEKLDKALIRPGRVDMIVKFDRADSQMIESIFRAIFAPLEGDDAPPSKVHGEKVVRFNPEDEQKKANDAAEATRKRDEIVAKVERLSVEFSAKIPAHEFSPAELQGYLLKNKRKPEAAVEGAEQWVLDTRKEKKEKELKEAEDKREAEEKAKKEVEEAKKKEEEEKKKEEEDKDTDGKTKTKKELKKSRKSRRRSGSKKSAGSDASDSDSDSDSSEDDSDSASGSDSEAEKKKKKKKKSKMEKTKKEKAKKEKVKKDEIKKPEETKKTEETKEETNPTAEATATAAAATPAAVDDKTKPAEEDAAASKPKLEVPTVTIDAVKVKDDVIVDANSPGAKTPGGDSGYGSH